MEAAYAKSSGKPKSRLDIQPQTGKVYKLIRTKRGECD